MKTDFQRLTESKDAMRAKLDKLPFAEKVRLLEQLNERARGIRAARLDMKTHALTDWSKFEDGARYRVRTSDSSLEHQPLASPDSQGDSQKISDPVLARLVLTWPSLSEERKRIIGSLLDLP
jgi:hypothetical protein